MTKKAQARPHLDKAVEFCNAARRALDDEHFNAACSLAVVAGIQAKDVVCTLVVGRTGKSDSHDEALVELRKSGPLEAQLEPTFRRLLSRKTKSQYSGPSVTGADAQDAVKRAERMLDEARALFDSSVS